MLLFSSHLQFQKVQRKIKQKITEDKNRERNTKAKNLDG